LIQAVLLTVAAAPAQGADNTSIERMATCKDSWLDWSKSDQAKLKSFGEHFRSTFVRKGSDAFFVPKSPQSIAGFHVLQVFPESIGMAVGFSVVVDAPFGKVKATLEKTFGKPLQKCDVSDGMRTCEFEIAEQRTLSLMAGDTKKDVTTLVGCYYYYAK
jgi:hypothetical protein